MYGKDFLSYVFASDEIPERDALTDAQQEAVRVLEQFAAAANREPSGFGRSFVLPGVGRYHQATDMSIANALRMQCGGDLEDVDEDDAVTDTLLRLARDAYPVLLLPKPENESLFEWPALSLGTAVHTNPRSEEAHRAILADEVLGKLFPGAPAPDTLTSYAAATEIYAELLLSTGRGGTFQLVMLPQIILISAYYRQALRDGLTPSDYLQVIREVVGDVRTLASRRQINVPMLVGLGNVRLANGARVRLAKSVLRDATAQERQLLASPGGRQQITAVLETTYPLKILSLRPWAPGPAEDIDETTKRWNRLQPQVARYQQRSQGVVNHARYSLLLASNEDAPIAAVPISNMVLSPLKEGLELSWPIDAGFRPVPEATIDQDLAQRSEEWAKKVDKSHPSNLDMSMRRLLGAVSVRFDPMDGFVDAVISWENMFGTGEGETTFRVCGAMAHLLEGDKPQQRLSLFRQLQELYRIRSSLVHGAQEPDALSATAHRDEAVRYALRAMRRLYDRPELLSAESSSVRGRNLLLNL